VRAFIRIGGRTLPHGEERTLTWGVRKMRRTILLLAVVALAATLFVPATAASPSAGDRVLPRQASGVWSWVNTGFDIWKETKKGVQLGTGTEDGTWTGTFDGTSVDYFTAKLWPSGAVFGLLTATFEGTVEDMSGTLEILTTFEVTEEMLEADPDASMRGTWMIVAGTDELSNLCGTGTWGPNAEEGAPYTGTIRACVPAEA
jgi:hypothetical protein